MKINVQAAALDCVKVMITHYSAACGSQRVSYYIVACVSYIEDLWTFCYLLLFTIISWKWTIQSYNLIIGRNVNNQAGPHLPTP